MPTSGGRGHQPDQEGITIRQQRPHPRIPPPQQRINQRPCPCRRADWLGPPRQPRLQGLNLLGQGGSGALQAQPVHIIKLAGLLALIGLIVLN